MLISMPKIDHPGLGTLQRQSESLTSITFYTLHFTPTKLLFNQSGCNFLFSGTYTGSAGTGCMQKKKKPPYAKTYNTATSMHNPALQSVSSVPTQHQLRQITSSVLSSLRPKSVAGSKSNARFNRYTQRPRVPCEPHLRSGSSSSAYPLASRRQPNASSAHQWRESS